MDELASISQGIAALGGGALSGVLVEAGAALGLGLGAVAAVVAVSPRWPREARVMRVKRHHAFRVDYRAQWMQLTRQLSQTHPLARESLGEQCLDALCATLRAPGGVLWSRDPEGRFRLEAHRGIAQAARFEDISPVTAWLAAREWIIDLDEWRRTPGQYAGLELPQALQSDPAAWLVVPLRTSGTLRAVALLHRPDSDACFDWETRDLLNAAATQMAALLALGDTAQRLVQAERFDAFNRSVAFALHDLKSLVSQLSLLADTAARDRDAPESGRELVPALNEIATQMRALLQGLRPVPVAEPVWTPIAPVLARARASITGRDSQRIEERIDPQVHERTVHADPERLARIIRHLLQNAVEATAAADIIHLEVQQEGEWLCLRIADSGPGVDPRLNPIHQLQPFVTTKPDGYGLGLFECQSYLAEVGGRWQMESRSEGGTVWRLWLPSRALQGLDPGAAD